MLRSKTALGIDISDGRINLALLKQSAKDIKLLKAASGPVPDGAIKNGNVENAAALAKAIKKLKTENRIYSHQAALSLVANPALVQIIDLPKDRPGSARQFVQDEAKHYAALPINRTAVDFCGIKTLGRRRALVVATDGARLTDAARTLRKKGLNIDAIEPAWVAYIRACYAKKIANKFDTNLLFALVRDDTLTLCVFRKQTLDFVRVKRIEPSAQSEGYFDWLAEQINAILKFYEPKELEKSSKWQITLVGGICGEHAKQDVESLRAKLDQVELEVRTPETAYLDTPVADTKHSNKPSPTAVGLAMKLLNIPGCELNINLLPQEIAQARTIEKQVLVSVNAAVVILVLMILSIGFFDAKTQKVNAQMNHKTRMQMSRNTRAMQNKLTLLEVQTAGISDKLDCLNTILNTSPSLKWGPVLNDIRLATPKMVRITGLSSGKDSKMSLEGQALSYEDIHLFVDMLNACKHIESASLTKTLKDDGSNGLIRYYISCSLVQ